MQHGSDLTSSLFFSLKSINGLLHQFGGAPRDNRRAQHFPFPSGAQARCLHRIKTQGSSWRTCGCPPVIPSPAPTPRGATFLLLTLYAAVIHKLSPPASARGLPVYKGCIFACRSHCEITLSPHQIFSSPQRILLWTSNKLFSTVPESGCLVLSVISH